MSGLSGSQAAATLATTLVGAKLGLFDKQTINAVLVVILVSLVVTPAMVSLFGRKVEASAEEEAVLGKAVLVPVWGESSRPVLDLAGRLATPDGGIVLAASFAQTDTPAGDLSFQRNLMTQAEGWLGKLGLETRTLFRVARTVPEGLLNAVLSENATLLLTEWHAKAHVDPGSPTSETFAHSPAPTVVANGDVCTFDRVVVVAGRDDLVRPGLQNAELAAHLGARLAHGHKLAVVASDLEAARPLFTETQHVEWIEAGDPIDWVVKGNLRATDLPFFAGLDTAQEAVRRMPELLKGRFLAAIAAHDATFHEREERVAGPVVVGRSLKPRPGHT